MVDSVGHIPNRTFSLFFLVKGSVVLLGIKMCSEKFTHTHTPLGDEA